MATASTPAEIFLESFLAPLVQANEVTIGLPVDRATFEVLCAEVETRGDRIAGLEVILQMQAARILPEPPLLVFDLDAMRVAVALHQLLFSFHGAAEAGRVSEERLARLAADTARMLAAVRPRAAHPDLAAQVVLHHLIVDPFFLLYRKDVSIFFRVGQKRFFGQQVEWMRLPFRWRVQYEEVLGTDVAAGIFAREAGHAFAMLLRYSPLTQLLRADRLFEEFAFDGLDVVLEHQALCRFAVNTIVDRGLASFMPAFASGFRALVEAGAPAAAIARVGRFLVTLALTREYWQPATPSERLLDARYEPPSDAMRFEVPAVDPEAAHGGETDATRRARLNREGWALVRALLAHAQPLGLPQPDRAADNTERLRQRLEALRPALGDAVERIDPLVARALSS